MKLRRIAPGYYTTLDGRFEIVKTIYPERSFPGQVLTNWYWKSTGGRSGGDDHYYTKADAVASLEHYLSSQVR